MLKKFALLLIAVAVAVKAAEPGQINQCKASDCTDCPTYLYLDQPGDADGLGILDSPECTVYDGGFDGWPRSDSGSAIVYHDVSQPDDGCAYILLSPASVTEPGCGFPLGIYRNAICVQNLMGSTYMWQRCCGQTCTDAGYRRSLRGSGWFGGVPDKRSAKDTLHTMSVHNADGSPVAVKEHRPAVYSEDTSKRSLVANVGAPARREIPAASVPLARRDCDGFTETRRYTTTGAPILFGGQVRGPASVTKEDSTSVSRTTSVSSTVGDPFGIVSATVGFETTEESSTSLSYQLEVPEGQLAEASWTPILSCIEGTFTGCGDAGDQQGNVCTASISSSGQPDGVYNAVIVS